MTNPYSPWVDGESVNAAKNYARIEQRLRTLEGRLNGWLVAPGYLTAAFPAGTGGAAAGSITIPAVGANAVILIDLELTPPGSSSVTTLITWTGDSRTTSLVTNFRTYITASTSTGNKADQQYQIPVMAGAAGTTSFTVTPNVNGCTARLWAFVTGG